MSSKQRGRADAVVTSEGVHRGQRVYVPLLLSLYDPLVPGLVDRFVWRYRSSKVLALYDELVADAHLDVEVGTGYYPRRCKFPTARPKITLLDINPNSLRKTSTRIQHYGPEVHQANILDPSPCHTAPSALSRSTRSCTAFPET